MARGKSRSGNWRRHVGPPTGGRAKKRGQSDKPKTIEDTQGPGTPTQPPKPLPPIIVLPGGSSVGPIIKPTKISVVGPPTGVLTAKRSSGRARPTGRPQGPPRSGSTPPGYLHSLDSVSAGTAAQIGHFGDIWGYVPLGPSKIVGSGDDLCRGHAVAMWFRLTGAPSAASGNWYEATLYCTINRVETSKPWFKLSLEAVPGNAAKCRFVVQGMQSGSGEIRGTDFTNATYSIFGADGVSPVLDKWFFICASRCGTANNAGIYLWTGDEQGNVCAGPWRSGGTSWWGDFGHTTFRAGLMGPPWNLVCPNSYRIPGDVCQLRHMSNINAAALGGWSDPYTQAFKDGGYLETYDAAAHAGYLESDYGAWETSAYWSFNEDRTVDPAHHSGLDFRSAASTAPSDGEMRNADNGYDDGPSLS